MFRLATLFHASPVTIWFHERLSVRLSPASILSPYFHHGHHPYQSLQYNFTGIDADLIFQSPCVCIGARKFRLLHNNEFHSDHRWRPVKSTKKYRYRLLTHIRPTSLLKAIIPPPHTIPVTDLAPIL
jgi:hypothetical protein